MDFNDFKAELIEEVKAANATSGEGTDASFARITTKYLQDIDAIPDFIPAFYTGNGKNNKLVRVDGYVYDEIDSTMSLFLVDFWVTKPDTLIKSSAMSLFNKLIYFVEEVYGDKLYKTVEKSTSAADLIGMLRQSKSFIRKIRLILLTNRNMSDRITTIESSDFDGIPLEYQIWDFERIYKTCISESGKQNIEIDFKNYTDEGIPCLEASTTDCSDYKSYLCILPGSVLADIYEKYGSQLLEGNVRSFLSTKVAVNKKIRETIIRFPKMFFAYNNGISVTASGLVIEDNGRGRFITFAKDFQIINGGQTTASISNARHRDKAKLEDIFVQMKLTEIDSDPEKTNDLVRNISKSSNSQNKVSEADFFSTHAFHIRIEQISRRIFAPASGGAQYSTKWFYERARGQYLQEQMRMTSSEKDKFVIQHPKKQVLSKTDLAKIRNTWEGLPQYVSRGAQTNFVKFAELTDEEWNTSEAKFNDKYFKETVALAILFKHTESVVTVQPWYEQGYRANIVTYSISLLKELIKKQFPKKSLDLSSIWNKQTIPDMLTNELVKITKAVFESITDPGREVMNVTQWCKRDRCWAIIKTKQIIINRELENLLVDISEVKSEEKDARIDQKIASETQLVEKALLLGADFWKKLFIFLNGKKIGSPDFDEAIKIAMRIPNKLPNSYQCSKLFEYLERAESEGFK